MVDAKAGASPGSNLGFIPDNYYLTYGSGPQIIHVDTAVTRTGKPSIRLDQHTASDVNTNRECDGTWYSVKPGDHIVAKCWIKTDNSTPTENADPTHGGRIGMDFYAPLGDGHITIVDGLPGNVNPYFGDEPTNHLAAMVHWNTPTWTLKTIDIVIPPTMYTKDVFGRTIPPTPITQFVLWMQALQVNDGTARGNAWFADAELYINPNFTSTAPPPPPPLPQNALIAVSSVTASSYVYCQPPSLAVDGIENLHNYWGTNAGGSGGVFPQWLKLDLGSVHSINTVITHFYYASIAWAYTYYIQVSNDSSSWTTIVSTKTGSGSVTDTFSQVGARFVRITITANTLNLAVQIEEIKVYGFN